MSVQVITSRPVKGKQVCLFTVDDFEKEDFNEETRTVKLWLRTKDNDVKELEVTLQGFDGNLIFLDTQSIEVFRPFHEKQFEVYTFIDYTENKHFLSQLAIWAEQVKMHILDLDEERPLTHGELVDYFRETYGDGKWALALAASAKEFVKYNEDCSVVVKGVVEVDNRKYEYTVTRRKNYIAIANFTEIK